MRNTAIAEERRTDHFHLAIHVTIPEVTEEAVPVITVTTQRCCNGHIVSTGPLFALADLDMPMPMPGLVLDDYARQVARAIESAIVNKTEHVVYGTRGRKIPASCMPVPTPSPEPLW